MRPYSFYPATRARFIPATGRFSTPNFSATRHAGMKNHVISSMPAANILRKEGGFDIQLAIPGLSKDQVNIELNENQLTISAIPNDQENQTTMIRKEFNYDTFKRSFRLHKDADINAISASFDQGLLTIHVPDLEKTITKINIQ